MTEEDAIEQAARAIYESKLFQPARAGDPWDGEPSATKTFCRAAACDVLKTLKRKPVAWRWRVKGTKAWALFEVYPDGAISDRTECEPLFL